MRHGTMRQTDKATMLSLHFVFSFILPNGMSESTLSQAWHRLDPTPKSTTIDALYEPSIEEGFQAGKPPLTRALAHAGRRARGCSSTFAPPSSSGWR